MRRRRITNGCRLLLVAWALGLWAHAAPGDEVLDDFEDLSGWTASVSPGAHLEIVQDQGHSGMAMRLDFDLRGGGYVLARKAVDLTLPANYAFRFQMRANAPPNNVEFKVIDRTGQNVWWYPQREFAFSSEWTPITIKKRRLAFAWGPGGGRRPLTEIGAIEIAISAATGGRGSVWIDALHLEARDPAAQVESPPDVEASTSLPGHEPERMLDGDPQTSWHSEDAATSQSVLLDFQRPREYGGLVIDWDPDDYATCYQVQTSDDGETWTTAYDCQTGNGGRDYVYLPDGESRYLRLVFEHSARGRGYGIRTLAVKPFEFSASRNQFFAAVAADAPPGTYPKYFTGRQTYWTVVGVDGDDREALINEEGMVEVDKGSFSIEPFVRLDGTLIGWNAVRTTQELAQGYLPIPSVTWTDDAFRLRVTAVAAGRPGSSTLYLSYRIDNVGDRHLVFDLYLAVRSFQVLPPWQALNMTGGVTAIHDLVYDARTVWVNHDKAVVSLTPPDGFGARTFEEGPITELLSRGQLPPWTVASDTLGYASGALQYRLPLAPGAAETVYLAVPFYGTDVVETAERLSAHGAAAVYAAELAAATRFWERALNRVEIRLPDAGADIVRTLKSTLAYLLINRDGPALQPGSRTYARSWIRDGAMSSAALLELGFTAPVRDFIEWYAQFQGPDGAIPCCVDRRGPDPTPEHDSNGEFLFAIAEYYRYTRDIGFLTAMWPAAVRAVDYLSALLAQHEGDAHAPGDAYFGVLPESISHEGYAAHPVHSYWDDFFALRGFKDAAALAPIVGDDAGAVRFGALRDTFQRDLYASIRKTIETKRLDYIPASVELGDLDPNSTAIALAPGGEQHNLPQAELLRTFDRYAADVERRQHDAGADDEGYTPYELRNVAAFVRLGQRERALAVLEELLADRRPLAWNQWAEIVWRHPEVPRFIGDMPHTWVGASFIQSVRSLFAYERESDRALVLAAGLPLAWVTADSGVIVQRMPTYYGPLSYRLEAAGPNALRLRLSGDLDVPPGGIVIQPPLPSALRRVTVSGQPIETFVADQATVAAFPAEVVLEY